MIFNGYCIIFDKITTMKMFHIDDFKCTLCANWFCPPFNLPYLLSCTHSVCTHCLHKSADSGQIICPEDLEVNSIHNININLTTKKALQRLMKEHKNYNENTQLECIKALSVSFDEILSAREKSIMNLQALIDQIFLAEIERIKNIHERTKLELTRPFRIVDDWKEIVSIYLTSLKKNPQVLESLNLTQLNHYIEEGRKIKLQLNNFFSVDFEKCAQKIISAPSMCFSNNFSLFQSGEPVKGAKKEKAEEKKKVSEFRKREQEESQFSLKSENSSIREEKISQPKKILENRLKISQIKRNSKKNSKQQSRNSSPLQSLSLNSLVSIPTTREGTGNLTKYFGNMSHDESDNFRDYIRNSVNRNQSSKESSKENSRPSSREQTPVQYKKDCMLISPDIIREQYTEEAEHEEQNENDEILLISQRDQWTLGNMNFLKEWEIAKKKTEEQELQVRQKGYYNCQKEKLSYMKKMQILRIQEILKETVVKDNYIELINESLHDVDIGLYLSNFNWNEIEIIKFVRTSLTDDQLNTILNYLMKSKVKALVLSSNNLTDISLDAFLHFVNVNNVLKNVYLPKNYINILRSKQKINLLKEKGINIYI